MTSLSFLYPIENDSKPLLFNLAGHISNVQDHRSTKYHEIFQNQMANLTEAIKSNFDRIIDKFYSKHIVTDTFIDDVRSVQSDTAYQKSSKVVHELYRQMKSRQDAEKYLDEICNVLSTEEDETLKDIATVMKGDLW